MTEILRELPKPGDLLAAVNSSGKTIFSLILGVGIYNDAFAMNVVEIRALRLYDRWQATYPISLKPKVSFKLSLFRDGNQLW